MKWLFQRVHGRANAHRRAEHLLLEYLTPDQRKDYLRDRKFIVESQFHRYYQISRPDQWGGAAAAPTIRRVEPDRRGFWRPLEGYCFVPAAGNGSIPEPDCFLAVALWISCNEERFLKTAVPRPIDWMLPSRLLVDQALIEAVGDLVIEALSTGLSLLTKTYRRAIYGKFLAPRRTSGRSLN